MHRRFTFAAVLVACLAISARADEAAHISAAGEATIVRTPDTARMTVMLVGEGPDMKSALASLATQRDAFKKRLDAVSPATSKITDPQLSLPADDPRQRIEMMMNNRGVPPSAQVVRVSCTVTAEWPLAGANAEARLLNAADLEARLKSPDAPKASAEPTTQSEAQEEMSAIQAAAQGNGRGVKSGEPAFVYVAQISAADRQKVIAEAYEKARAAASEAASAAGLSLYSAAEIKASLEQGRDKPEDAQSVYLEMLLNGGQPQPSTKMPTEAVEPQPTTVSLRATVTATFTLVSK